MSIQDERHALGLEPIAPVSTALADAAPDKRKTIVLTAESEGSTRHNQYPRYNKTQNAVMKGITLRKHHWKTYFPKLFGLVEITSKQGWNATNFNLWMRPSSTPWPHIGPPVPPASALLGFRRIIRKQQKQRGWLFLNWPFSVLRPNKEMNKTKSYTQIVSFFSPFLKIVRSYWGLKEKSVGFYSWSSKLNFPGSSRIPLTLNVKRSVLENHHSIAG